MTDQGELPVVRLRPNKGKAYLGGQPWVYRDELVLDRRTSRLEPGSVVRLQDSARVDVGSVAINPSAGIAARELDRDPAVPIDAAWIGSRLARAAALRERFYPRPFYRFCNGEGDGLPGLIVDRFGAHFAIQPNTAWAEANLSLIVDALRERLAPEGILVNRDSRGRAQEGLSDGREVVHGKIPERIAVEGPCARMFADLGAGQKTGAYFDQFANHARVAGICAGQRMLDVFSHTGGFALSALASGAQEAVAVDGSAVALELAEAAAEAAGLAERLRTIRSDAFDAMKQLAEEGERFGVVICDPPAFAPRKAALDAGLRAYERVAARALPLVAPQGLFYICSCSHAVTPDALREAVSRALHRAQRRGRLISSSGAGPDHPVHPALPAHGYLKMLGFALD